MLAGAAMETAADGTGIAAALLEEALAALGVAAVAVWLAEPDGGLELAGQAGFAARDASRWRRIHPDLATPALWAADDGHRDLVARWPPGPRGLARRARAPRCSAAGRGARGWCSRCPVPGRPSAPWRSAGPGRSPSSAAPLRRQLGALAEVCAQAVGTRLRTGVLAADQRASWAFSLLDGLLGSAMYATAVRAAARSPTS